MAISGVHTSAVKTSSAGIRCYLPSSDTQEGRLAKYHVVIHTAVWKCLESDPFRSADTTSTPIRIQSVLWQSQGCHTLQVGCVLTRRRREKEQRRQCRQLGRAPQKALACPVEMRFRVWWVGEICAEDLHNTRYTLTPALNRGLKILNIVNSRRLRRRERQARSHPASHGTPHTADTVLTSSPHSAPSCK